MYCSFLLADCMKILTRKPYCQMNHRLQFCHIRKIDGKDRPASQVTADFNTALVGRNDRFCQRQAQPNALGVFGKAAAVKPLKDMV